MLYSGYKVRQGMPHVKLGISPETTITASMTSACLCSCLRQGRECGHHRHVLQSVSGLLPLPLINFPPQFPCPHFCSTFRFITGWRGVGWWRASIQFYFCPRRSISANHLATHSLIRVHEPKAKKAQNMEPALASRAITPGGSPGS